MAEYEKPKPRPLPKKQLKRKWENAKKRNKKSQYKLNDDFPPKGIKPKAGG